MRLGQVLADSSMVSEVLALLNTLDVPPLWLGAGAICGTVWNSVFGYDPAHGIKDLDIVYFDGGLDAEAEAGIASKVAGIVGHIGLWADVKNQASVHTWYPDKFGSVIAPYSSLRSAIRTWPTTSSAVAVRLVGDDLAVEAPYGLDDLFGLVVRPNRIQVPRQVYEEKAARYHTCWPELTILPWEEGIGVDGSAYIQV